MKNIKPRIKICCISSIDELKLAVSYGASAIGLVSSMPSGPGVISEELITTIAAAVPPGVSSFLLTSKQSVREIVDQQKRTGVNTIQICDKLIDGTHAQLKTYMPGISIVQVVHVTGPGSIDEAIRLSENVDAILLDSGDQSLLVKELGGTGRTHNWDYSKTIREKISVPLYLAGGLNSSNVNEAVVKVKPFGIDLCGGVRTNGHLDENKLRKFFAVINNL